jgi:CheY-like chemotaxis protein
MTSEVAERAFEPFFTTRAFIKAAGLGLTIVHSVTQFHAGQVELTTAPDEGTTVTLWLPKPGARSPERLASVGGSLFSSSKPRKKVLLIEDDPLVKEVLRAWVMGCELELHSTENAASALRLVHRDPEQWVLAICETQLKGGTGADIRSELQATLPHVDWIFLANKNESSARSADGTGSKEALVLRKPFSHKAFVEIVRKYVPA